MQQAARFLLSLDRKSQQGEESLYAHTGWARKGMDEILSQFFYAAADAEKMYL